MPSTSLALFAGSYDAQMMFGGWGGTWGNGGAMGFTITCDGEIIVTRTVDGDTNANEKVTDFTFTDGLLKFFMPTGNTERFVRLGVAETMQNAYVFRPVTQFPGNLCEGGCMSGIYDYIESSLDCRAYATSSTDW
jgi:hypothetical protein